MMQEKSKLRKILLEKRLSLSARQIHEYSEKIIKKLINYVNWHEISIINTYHTIKINNEIDINDLLDFIQQNHPNIQIDIAENKISKSRRIPKGKSYDLIIVPLIGFDRNGNRLGYGGGYYDKFLAGNTYTQAIGLAYSLQEVESLPVEEHDQKLDLIITEKEIIKP